VTEIDIPFSQFLRVSALTGTRYKLTLALGRVCREALDVYDRLQEGVKEAQAGALTPEKVEAYRRLCEDKPDDYIDARQVPFTDAEVSNPNEWHSYGAKLLLETLSDRSLGIKSALNVGGYNDRHFAYMAPRFPDIKFTSVDFMSEAKMKAFHRLLPQSSNWGFKSGYALDLLRRGETDADLVFLASTSLLFNNKELDLYCDELAKRSKVVVINEGWGAVAASSRVSALSIFPSVIRPEDIPEDAPVTRSMEGAYYFYAHNYPAKLAKRGFDIRLSRVKAIGNHALYLYQLVAVKK
jgi:hypothetical protein